MKTTFLKSAFFLLSVLLCAGFSSESSSGTRGGGDPDAMEFLDLLNQVSVFLERSPLIIAHENAFRGVALVDQLTAEMNDERLTPIRFTSEVLVDASGAEKIALYSTDPLRITVNRAAWKALSKANKISVAGLELLGLMEMANRYNLSKLILAEAVTHLNDLRASGWEVTFISSSDNFATLVRPGSFENSTSTHFRPIVLSSAIANPDAAALMICNTLGFKNLLLYSLGAVTDFDIGDATLFDHTGTFTKVISLKKNDPSYKVLADISCGY